MPAQAPSAAPFRAAEELLEYSIGAEDIVKVAVLGHDDLTQTIVVQPDGTFIYPLIGRVKAADLTPKELERWLADAGLVDVGVECDAALAYFSARRPG